MKWLWVCAGVSLASAAWGQGRLLVFADKNYLGPAVGKFEPSRGWIAADDFYEPPNPQDPFTLYGVAGKLADVRIVDPRRAWPQGTFADWSAKISPWDWTVQPHAIAVAGAGAAPARLARKLPLDDPSAVAVVAEFLKRKGLRVSHPLLTQAFAVDLDGDGMDEQLICAHSDASALRDHEPAAIYALALLHFKARAGAERTAALFSQASYKPSDRTMAQQQRFYGVRHFERWLGFLDLTGDGRLEAVLYDAQVDGTQVDVFSFDGRRAVRVLNVFRPF